MIPRPRRFRSYPVLRARVMRVTLTKEGPQLRTIAPGMCAVVVDWINVCGRVQGRRSRITVCCHCHS